MTTPQNQPQPDAAATAAAAAAVEAARADASKTTLTLAAEITEACIGAGAPALAAAFIREGATMDHVKAKLGTAQKIREAVALARKANASISEGAADEYINAGKSVEEVREDLLNKMVANAETQPTSSAIKPGSGLEPKRGAMAAGMKKLCGIKE